MILSHSVCGLNENIWVCLICSYTGCGRYSNRHAKEHFLQAGHGLTIELVTGRIWSYVQDDFVHVAGSLIVCTVGTLTCRRVMSKRIEGKR